MYSIAISKQLKAYSWTPGLKGINLTLPTNPEETEGKFFFTAYRTGEIKTIKQAYDLVNTHAERIKAQGGFW